MKIRKLTAIVAVVLASLSVVASADVEPAGGGLYYGEKSGISFLGPVKGTSDEVLFALGYYDFMLTGAATVSATSLSPTTNNVQLIGKNNGKIWDYEIWNGNGDWVSIGDLVSGVVATAKNKSFSATEDAVVLNQYAKGMRVSYWVDLIPDDVKYTTAGGSATMTATAVVPEPLSILSACSILAPMGFVFRRKRA